MKTNMIKRLLIVVMVIMVMTSVAITAHAATPKLNIPSIEIPDISDNVRDNIKVEVSDNFWDNWFTEHPFNIDFSKINFDFFGFDFN